jgi:UPF0755 protein
VDVLNRSDVLTGPAPLPLEGSLLPETYEVVRGQSRASLLKRMADDRERLLATLWANRQPGLPFADADQAVTLASIVEKETALTAERPMARVPLATVCAPRNSPRRAPTTPT